MDSLLDKIRSSRNHRITTQQNVCIMLFIAKLLLIQSARRPMTSRPFSLDSKRNENTQRVLNRLTGVSSSVAFTKNEITEKVYMKFISKIRSLSKIRSPPINNNSILLSSLLIPIQLLKKKHGTCRISLRKPRPKNLQKSRKLRNRLQRRCLALALKSKTNRAFSNKRNEESKTTIANLMQMTKKHKSFVENLKFRSPARKISHFFNGLNLTTEDNGRILYRVRG